MTPDPENRAEKDAGEDVTWTRGSDQVAGSMDCRARLWPSQSNATEKTRFHTSSLRQRARRIVSPHHPFEDLFC